MLILQNSVSVCCCQTDARSYSSFVTITVLHTVWKWLGPS